MRDYGKVQTAFWTSADIQSLSDDAKMLALYLLSSPHTNQIGCFRLPDGYAAEDLKWGTERVTKGFQELSTNGFATRDEASKWVVIHKFTRWNEIENPNQAKAAVKLFEQVPDTCPVKPMLARALRDFSPRFPAEVWKPFETLSEGLEEQFRNQEHEHEQEHEQEQEISNPTGLLVDSDAADLLGQSSATPCPHQEIIAAYHELLPACPSIREWTPARQKALRTRWAEDRSRQSVDYWRKLFAYIAESRFLTGRTQSNNGKPPFTASLDWIVKAENFAKIREGRYHKEAA